jgi:hypothetical protein
VPSNKKGSYFSKENMQMEETVMIKVQVHIRCMICAGHEELKSVELPYRVNKCPKCNEDGLYIDVIDVDKTQGDGKIKCLSDAPQCDYREAQLCRYLDYTDVQAKPACSDPALNTTVDYTTHCLECENQYGKCTCGEG